MNEMRITTSGGVTKSEKSRKIAVTARKSLSAYRWT